jgi:hypothetical protein
VEEPDQEGGAVDHRGVDHLPQTGGARFEDRAHDPERQQHPAAPEVADEVQRQQRPLARGANVLSTPLIAM